MSPTMSPVTTEREMTTLLDLRPETSLGLLTSAVVGRVVHSEGPGRVRVPVRHTLHRGTVVFQEPSAGSLTGLAGSEVAFEADRYDVDEQSGWTVIVRGRLERVAETAPGDLDLPTHIGDDSSDQVWLRIVPSEITGRRIFPLPEVD